MGPSCQPLAPSTSPWVPLPQPLKMALTTPLATCTVSAPQEVCPRHRPVWLRDGPTATATGQEPWGPWARLG